MRTALLLSLFLLIYFIGCNVEKTHSDLKQNAPPRVKSIDSLSTQVDDTELYIGNSKGIVSYNNNGQYESRGAGIVYNYDGSIYAKFSFSKGTLEVAGEKVDLFEVDSKILNEKRIGFDPKEFYPETGAIIQFVCTNLTEKYFEVIVDHENDTKKLIDRNSEIFSFKTWEEHLFTAFIGFDQTTNPLRTHPSVSSEVISLNKQYTFDVTEVENEWIKLECNTECLLCKQNEPVEGWVQWKRDDYIIIKLYYMC